MASNLLSENTSVDDCDIFYLTLSSLVCCVFFFFFPPREKDLNAKFIISMEKNKTTITNLKVSKHKLKKGVLTEQLPEYDRTKQWCSLYCGPQLLMYNVEQVPFGEMG